jgi:ribulose-phosphate 3-epimerase
MIKIASSVLAADFARLGDEIESVSTSDYIHFDVMDGLFVHNISFGIPVLKSVRKVTDMILDVHLMIDSPSRYIKEFADAGADIITFHVEAEEPENMINVIETIHKLGKKAGISISPGTPAEALLPYINSLDLVLVMTVEPGYGGQTFKKETLPKIAFIRSVIDERGINCELEVDGGINIETAKLCVDSGANVLVAGVDVFDAVDRAAQISKLRSV